MTEFFLITLRTNVIHFAIKTSEVKDELRKYYLAARLYDYYNCEVKVKVSV